ncbi:hypothetical protein AB0I82_05675 [Streptomyces sp. NPDC050315]|uniref:hypothetical protein n=1 Tax=Streptomyces sp. NPDC050315 TaxID=3155039 RepID=UPI0034433FD9
MTDNPDRPVPPENPPPDEPAREPSARRRRSRRALLIALLALIVAVGATLWITIGPDGPTSSLRADLTRSAEMLRKAPALHYTGTIKVKDQKAAKLDLIVSNPGDALGTLKPARNRTLDYLGTDGKSFVRGDADDWKSLGMADKSKVLAEKPQMTPPGLLFSRDLAATLAPSALAKTLLMEDVPDEKITAGEPVTIGDHTCTPIHADGMTICLGEELEGGARFVDRITFPGSSAVLDIEAMPRAEVNRFYSAFPKKLDTARKAVDPRVDVTTQILRDYKGACGPTACTFTARVTVTLLGETSSVDADREVQVNYAWVIDRDGTSVPLDRDCSGAVLIKSGRSSDLSCTAKGRPVSGGGASSGQYHGEIHTSDIALTTAEYERLVRRAADNREKVAALPDLPSPR